MNESQHSVTEERLETRRITGWKLHLLIFIEFAVIMVLYEFLHTAFTKGNHTIMGYLITLVFILLSTAITGIFIKRLQKRRMFDEKRRLDTLEKLEEALAEIKTLSGLLPICAHCKKIQDETGDWQEVESYISHHSDTRFSHGMCDACTKELYPDVWEQMQREKGK